MGHNAGGNFGSISAEHLAGVSHRPFDWLQCDLVGHWSERDDGDYVDIQLWRWEKVKSIKANALCTAGISVAVISLACGDAIQTAGSTSEMFGWTFLSCVLLAIAIVLCAIGVNAENEKNGKKNHKIHRVPHHTNEWRDVQ